MAALTPQLADLVAAARAASAHAYCPYSRFPVGAAILGAGGEIVQGCNVENASYGLTMCAERVAVYRAVVKGCTPISALAVYTPTPHPTMPCGACRQVIHEFGRQALIISACDGPLIRQQPLSELLPEPFGPADLR